MLWIASLPLGLWQPMGWACVPAVFAISFIFMGIDEIGVQIEEPFAILPLTPLVKVIARDVWVAAGFAEELRAGGSNGAGGAVAAASA
jgi:predicted membrane chloride channel (bestrophin family)